MCIRNFLAIVCTKEEIVKKGKIKTNEKEIREFFCELKHVKVAIEAPASYSHIVDTLAIA